MIYVTADLHFGLSAQSDSATRKLAEYLSQTTSRNDIVCLAGDLGSEDDHVVECLKLFRNVRATKLALPGNHDVWTDGTDSWERYERFSILLQEHDFHALHQKPFRQGDLGIIGSMGWYDYSFVDIQGLNLGEAKARLWNDAKYVQWRWGDSELAIHLGELLCKQAEQIAAYEKKLVITHHLPTSQLLFQPRWLVPRYWREANAFLGSDFYSSLLSHLSPLDWICGHSHMAREARLGDMRFFSIGSDYKKKELMIRLSGQWERRIFT